MLPFHTLIPLFFWIPSPFFWGGQYWVFIAARRLSLVAASGTTLVALHGLLVAVASLVAEHRLWGAQAQQLWCMGPVASSWTRDQTRVLQWQAEP